MPPANRHIIGRQQFHLSLPGQQEAYALQQRVGRLYWNKIAPALEQLFDRLAGPELLIEIDRLEVDLGTVNLFNLDKELEVKILSRLEETLRKEIRTGSISTNRRHVRLGRFEQWLFFLENGHLPWVSPSVQPEAEWRTAVIETLALREPAVEQLRRLLTQSATARQRLLRQYPGEFWVKLIEAFTARPQLKLLDFQQRLFQFLNALDEKQRVALFRPAHRSKWVPGFSRSTFRQAFWERAMDTAILAAWQPGWEELAIEIIRSLFHEAAVSAAWPLIENESRRDDAGKQMKAIFSGLVQDDGLVPKRSPQQPTAPLAGEETKPQQGTEGPLAEDSSAPPPGAPLPEKRQDSRLDSRDRPAEPGEQGDAEEPEINRTVPEAEEEKESLEATGRMEGREQKRKEKKPSKKLEAPSSEDSESQAASLPEGTALFVQNAGLILLHPYLPPFFREFRLLKNDKFVDEAAQQRAVHLLQLLATGETALPEYEMLLPKFLCGLSFDIPIEREIEATEGEKEEAMHLLSTVIRHWGTLGSASPDGLREGFLQRDGKLEKRKNGWYLAVEQKAIDILLDQLPWSISMFQLPWMPEVLRVEWV